MPLRRIVTDEDRASLLYVYATPPPALRARLDALGVCPQSRFGPHITVYRSYRCIADAQEARMALEVLIDGREPLPCTIIDAAHVGPNANIPALAVESDALRRFHEDVALRFLFAGSAHESDYFGKHYFPHLSVRRDADPSSLASLVGVAFSLSQVRLACREDGRWEDVASFLLGRPYP